MRVWPMGLALAGAAMAGCRASLPADFDAPDAGSRIRAVVAAAGKPTPEDLAQMVRSLGSDDPALRSMAIAALERTAGERFGYDAWAPRGERRAAIDRWEGWLDAYRPPGRGEAAWPDG